MPPPGCRDIAMLALLKRIVAPACALCLLAAATAAAGEGFEGAVARFAADSFAETEAAINEVAASGHDMAAPVIQALQDGRLLFDGAARKVYIRDPAGKVVDARTGQIGSPSASLKQVRLNNRLRRAVEA